MQEDKKRIVLFLRKPVFRRIEEIVLQALCLIISKTVEILSRLIGRLRGDKCAIRDLIDPGRGPVCHIHPCSFIGCFYQVCAFSRKLNRGIIPEVKKKADPSFEESALWLPN